MNKKTVARLVFNGVLFALVMLLTFWSVLRGQSIPGIVGMVKRMPCPYVLAATGLAVLFVSGEGCMIWRLLKGVGERTTVLRCIAYSFIGFFFSGITPSSTGGQPVQLYFMKRDNISLSASTVVLMTVGIFYKMVLVFIGTGILLFWNGPLMGCLDKYYGLYLTGLLLNAVVVFFLLMLMLSQRAVRRCFYRVESILVSLRLWRKSVSRKEKIESFLANYEDTLRFLRGNKRLIAEIVMGTFLQRLSVFVLTYVVYRGLGLSGTGMADIVLLQASVYVAVDMLPLPGAQGITEAMYRSVFRNIFSGETLPASICIIRGVSFYLMLLLGLAVFGIAKSRAGRGKR